MKIYVFPFLSAVFLLAGCTTFSDDGTPAIRKGNDSILSFGKLGSAIEDAPAGGWVMLGDQYTYETFAKKPFLRQLKLQNRFSAISLPQYLLILPKYPLNPPRVPDYQASGPPFRRQQAHLACWRLSKGSNTSPSDGFVHSL